MKKLVKNLWRLGFRDVNCVKVPVVVVKERAAKIVSGWYVTLAAQHQPCHFLFGAGPVGAPFSPDAIIKFERSGRVCAAKIADKLTLEDVVEVVKNGYMSKAVTYETDQIPDFVISALKTLSTDSNGDGEVGLDELTDTVKELWEK